VDPNEGLPALRKQWVEERIARDGACYTQMYYAKKGQLTKEMAFVAAREGMQPDFVLSEVARGRAIIPANREHIELEPTIIGTSSSPATLPTYCAATRGFGVMYMSIHVCFAYYAC
jgi:phosphomethylpyrimidine synthase